MLVKYHEYLKHSPKKHDVHASPDSPDGELFSLPFDLRTRSEHRRARSNSWPFS